MINIHSIQPDVELRDFLQNRVSVVLPDGETQAVSVYGDWERPVNYTPDDFIVIYLNGDISGVGMDTPFASGAILVSLYCRMNEDGTVKKSRVRKILEQFDSLVEKLVTQHYHFEYDAERFITPTTPNITSGYSVTNLNLRWNTTSNFNS